MKKNRKFFKIIFAMLLLIITTTNSVFAFNINDIDNSGSKDFEPVGNSIVKVLTTIGMVASVLVLVILGIKYMMGSLEERAEYKRTLMPYLIGAICVFGASSIASIIYNVAKDL